MSGTSGRSGVTFTTRLGRSCARAAEVRAVAALRYRYGVIREIWTQRGLLLFAINIQHYLLIHEHLNLVKYIFILLGRIRLWKWKGFAPGVLARNLSALAPQPHAGVYCLCPPRLCSALPPLHQDLCTRHSPAALFVLREQ